MSDARNLQFVDTSVLIYAHDVSAGSKHRQARELIDALWRSGEGCLSIQVLQEFYVSLTQKLPKRLSPGRVAEIVADLATWRVHSPSAESVMDAIRLQQVHRISFWDAMLVASALDLGCQILWSEDLSLAQTLGTVTVRSPF
jgi:predicted nucleic acid-binding protein